MIIPKTMQALVARGKGKYALEEVATPMPGYGEILIKVDACGICAGDIKAARGAARFWGGDGMPGYCEPPFIPGHEFAGEIALMGAGAEGGFQVGDRLVTEQLVPCGECRYCNDGRYWLCDPHLVYGFKKSLSGGMAQYALLPRRARNYKIPKRLPIERAALIEPYACALHGVEQARISAEHTVVLSGAGTLGLGMIGPIKRRNPKMLIALDMNDKRLKLAREFGADVVINPGKERAAQLVKDLTGGYGCDVYIEVAGHPSSVTQGLDMICKGGTFVEFSVFNAPAVADWSIIGDAKEITIRGSQLSPNCYPATIEGMISGELPVSGVVTHKYKLDDWEAAFDAAQAGDAIKVIVSP